MIIADEQNDYGNAEGWYQALQTKANDRTGDDQLKQKLLLKLHEEALQLNLKQ